MIGTEQGLFSIIGTRHRVGGARLHTRLYCLLLTGYSVAKQLSIWPRLIHICINVQIQDQRTRVVPTPLCLVCLAYHKLRL